MEIVAEKKVKTRKSHNCWGCTDEYPAGSEMKAVTCTDGGKIETIYWCNTCDSYLRKHRAELDPWNDGFTYGAIREEMIEAN